ncbi:TPR-like protein [Punctularia strigosozonata HHB-11173 SS5]|uniref:TPR-like protein n=1 Tax=Punctularia strigosozonata (strain HHB-11173) TaxID=741275 RepID=UPI000441848E|nr:TPR-like protein [Punctularia strigosozonata HHB-11173 SS5]EIN09705.1 TPR-like protein [Punctularia strigosozonata HHB-11173 SS5]
MSTANWPEDVRVKIETAQKLKDQGDQAFKAGDARGALVHYHQSLMYVKGISRNTTDAMSGGANDGTRPKTEVDEFEEKIYANMSACHLKTENWRRAVETADQALKKNPDNWKAMFRKGKALGLQGYYEKATAILEDLAKKNPADEPAVSAELKRIRALDKEAEKKHNQKMKGWLSRDKGENWLLGNQASSSTEDEEMEEIKSPAIQAAGL